MTDPAPQDRMPAEPAGDAGLVDRAQSGSPDALNQLIDECRDYLLLVANSELDRKLHAKVAPSDLVQETLMRAHERFEQFRGNSEKDFLAWIRRILLNHLVNVRRDLHRDKRDVSREQPMAGNSAVRLPALDPPTPDETPSRQVAHEETSQALVNALHRLPKDYRQAVILRNWQRASFAEIGEQLGRSEDAARKLWYRAIERLQQELHDPDATRGR